MLKRISILTIFVLFATFSACKPMPSQPSSTSQPPANNDTAPPPTPPSEPAPPKNEAVDMPLTLPVLDAFFSDDAFAGELKQKVGLTGDQVAKLRRTAREETAKLNEPEKQNNSSDGSTDAA